MEGFLSLRALQLYMEAEEDAHTEEDYEDEHTVPEVSAISINPLSYVFPALRVEESGLLEKWVFAADLISPQSSTDIEFLILRGEGHMAEVKLSTVVTAPVRSGYPNVYEVLVDPPQLVLAGDYVGIRVSISNLQPLWQQGTGTVYHLLTSGGSLILDGVANPLFAAQIQGKSIHV